MEPTKLRREQPAAGPPGSLIEEILDFRANRPRWVTALDSGMTYTSYGKLTLVKGVSSPLAHDAVVRIQFSCRRNKKEYKAS